MNTQTVFTFAKWRVRDGQLEAVLELLAELIVGSAAEEGNLSYQVFQDNSDANTLVLYESYTDQAALAAHRNSVHFQTLVKGKIVPLLEEREIIEASTVTP